MTVDQLNPEHIVHAMFLIFTGAALIATLVLYTKQSLLVAYILLGMIIGPSGLKWIPDPHVIEKFSDIGIMFLLFLLGLHLQPKNLLTMLRKAVVVSVLSSIVFGALGYFVGKAMGFTLTENLVIAATMLFSSTIIGLKLLPTTILHHQHTGEVMISILLVQDLIAIFALLILNAVGLGGDIGQDIIKVVIGLPALVLLAFAFERFILLRLFTKFDYVQEYLFLCAIGWCLGMAELSKVFGLSTETGAFIAGVALAEGPIALYIAESLKPLRDFFLVLFFFSVGASFKFNLLNEIIVPAVILAGLVLLVKPWLYSWLLSRSGEDKNVSWEVGVRLGQGSEFGLLLGYLAVDIASKVPSFNFGAQASSLIQATTIITFFISSYWVVFRFPTPMATSDRMRAD